jgi:lipopolysaccharide biosynthesis regulator YciM
MRRSPALILLLLGVLLSGPAARAAHAKPPPPTGLRPVAVQDLHYGDVLFHFYAGDEFDALVRLEAYDYWQRMPHHEQDAALLAGGLYLTLGMHNEAGRRFETLLTDRVPVTVRNEAWFYLGKIWYERGYYDRSEQAFGNISGTLSPNLEGERQHLLINALMRQGRYDEAATRLRNWHGPEDWMAYARFNLGVALASQDRLQEAAPVLEAVGTMNAAGSEMQSLRDKANLALGYAWLQKDNPQAARTALARVRLVGPYATRALLGMGWADAALGQYRDALTPWTELHNRSLLDAAVQESYLAVPYAYAKLNANGQAAEYYESAVSSFESESDSIDVAVARISEGHMLDDLLGGDPDAQRLGWFWQLKQLPQAPESRYLYTLLADNDFQEGLKNYRDLGYLSGTLGRWDENLDAYHDMVDTRRQAYAERLPRADALLASNATLPMLTERAAIDSRLTAIETGADVAALGSPAERAQWAKIRQLESAASDAGGDSALATERDKIRLMKGVLYWQLDANFKERDYAARRELRALDAQLNEAQNRWVRVQRARGSVPTDTDQFAARIAALAGRVARLRTSLDQAAAEQKQFLEKLANDALLEQKQRLEAYEVQAHYALADIYDRASTPPAAPTAPPPGGAQAPGEENPAPGADTSAPSGDTPPSPDAPAPSAPVPDANPTGS